jgi:hypothetical protein
MGMGQDAGPAAAAINTLRLAYDKLSASLQPLTFKVITDAVKAVGTFLPNLAPFAQAGGKAIDGLLGKVNTFFASADFKKWLDKFLPLVGPAIGALGSGFGKVAVSVGKLFTLMSSHDVVHAINTTFDAINGIINGTNNFVLTLMSNWDRMTGAFAQGWQNIQSFLGGGSPGGPSVANLPSSLGNLGNLNLTGLSGFNTSASGPGGGKIGHLASGGYGSGLTLVGESGPELMNLPSGTRVNSHAQTMRMLSVAARGGAWNGGRGSGAGGVVIQVGGGSGLDRLFAQWLRQQTRVLGGGGPNSVQIAWGQTH